MGLKLKTELQGAMRKSVYIEVADEQTYDDGKKMIADNAIVVVVGTNSYIGNTVARSLMVDLLIQDLTAPSTNDGGRLHWIDASEDVVCQGMTVPIADVKEAHRLATEQAQIIFG